MAITPAVRRNLQRNESKCHQRGPCAADHERLSAVADPAHVSCGCSYGRHLGVAGAEGGAHESHRQDQPSASATQYTPAMPRKTALMSTRTLGPHHVTIGAAKKSTTPSADANRVLRVRRSRS